MINSIMQNKVKCESNKNNIQSLGQMIFKKKYYHHLQPVKGVISLIT